ncbi:MAG: T9SS type A sorting domain-containing protein [Bacteroidales bacterium]|nr:T9SS type A sorting domain-containing protein [Bacteroidales bacterium]MBO7648842.1 T9SS type A sorting domain-containing protein [Bacteroidales bacterium]
MKYSLWKNSLLFLILLVFTVTVGYAQGIRFTLLESTSDGAVVRVEYPNYKCTPVDVNGVVMQKLSMPQAYPVLETGAPEMLQTAVSLIVPDGSNPTVEVLESDYTLVRNFELVPSKGRLYRNVDPATVGYVKGASYFENRFLNDNTVHVGETYRLRDYSGVALHFYPFAYNPVSKQLKAYSSMTVRVRYNSRAGIRHLDRVAKGFNDIYATHFLNYSTVKSTPLEEHGDMLILAPDNFCEAMEPYATWKKRNGYAAEIVPLSVAGSTSTAIKNYIRNYYNSHNLAYVILVGDNQQFPTISAGGNISDNYYGELVGNDNYPDIIIGKISAENLNQVSTQINKFIQYEKDPQETAHLPVFLGIASDQGPGDNNEYDYAHIRNIDNILMNYTYTSGYEMFEGSQGGLDASGNPTASMVAQALNSGVGIINYCGHGSETSWSSSNFSVSNVNSLTNYNKLPFIISVACVNGAYNGRTCFAEAWLRAEKNGQPTGAVGALMSTINQPWDPPMCAQDRMIELLTGANNTAQRHTFGCITFNGIIHMLDVYNDYEVSRTWVLFGDPALQVRTAVPQNLLVDHPISLPFGVSDVTFTSAVSGARVTLMCHDQIIAQGSIQGGSLAMELPATLTVGDTVQVLATALNYVPYQGSFQLVPNDGPFLICQNFVLNDDKNHNGLADYGETVTIDAVMKNIGTQPANNSTVQISSSDPYITILDNSLTVATMAADAMQTFTAAFQLRVSNEAPAFHDANIQLAITTEGETRNFNRTLKLHAPMFQSGDVVVDDAQTGNGDGRLDIGETARLRIPITNVGNGISHVGNITATNPDGNLTINRGVYDLPGMAVNGIKILEINVKSNSEQPTSSTIRLTVFSNDDFRQVLEIPVKIGSVQEDFETGDFTAFEWSNNGSHPWTITTQNPYEGTYAARSGQIGNSASSTMSITRTHESADTLSFYYRVSSEQDYDFLKFYIDNQVKESWSGNVGWTRYSILVPAGTHTYKWQYVKDAYVSSGSDLAAIDAISFPCLGKTSTDIVDYFVSDIVALPNPTTGSVTLQLPVDLAESNVQCQVFDLTGRLLMQQEISADKSVISLENLTAGMYLLKILDTYNKNVLGTIKVIKK